MERGWSAHIASSMCTQFHMKLGHREQLVKVKYCHDPAWVSKASWTELLPRKWCLSLIKWTKDVMILVFCWYADIPDIFQCEIIVPLLSEVCKVSVRKFTLNLPTFHWHFSGYVTHFPLSFPVIFHISWDLNLNFPFSKLADLSWDLFRQDTCTFTFWCHSKIQSYVQDHKRSCRDDMMSCLKLCNVRWSYKTSNKLHQSPDLCLVYVKLWRHCQTSLVNTNNCTNTVEKESLTQLLLTVSWMEEGRGTLRLKAWRTFHQKSI